ncbi:MAG: alanine dehydrogenase [Bacteroidota bacterium]|nr:alanine dehydrogenase [Bacteroidota bacterium]
MAIFHKSFLPREETLEIAKKRKSLKIGIPKDEDRNENRIAITPLAVELLINQGHHVFLESGAGNDANFSDKDFSEKGASIVSSKSEVMKSDIIIKVSPFTFDEIEMLEETQLIISALNIATLSVDYIRALMNRKVTALAFELIKDHDDCFPVLKSMSEIVGSTAILIAAEYLSKEKVGKGKILGGITGVNPSEVVILGAGTSGENAARTALALGAMVKVFDNSINNLGKMQQNINQRIFTSVLQPKILRNALKTADVVIGCMETLELSSPYLITEDMVEQMKSGSVIIDINIDQGGIFETSSLTSHAKPYFIKHGVIHYCVPNIASRVARTASYALSNIFTPVLSHLGDSGGISSLIREDIGLRKGVYIYNGILTNSYIGDYFSITSKDIDLLIAAF